jgi:O-antigen/teichoic acid export membrane protein
MNTTQRIVKNAGFLIISNLFSYFLYMWAVMIMANYLSPHDYGVITLGFSFKVLCALPVIWVWGC